MAAVWIRSSPAARLSSLADVAAAASTVVEGAEVQDGGPAFEPPMVA
jgi:hypothetical protein